MPRNFLIGETSDLPRGCPAIFSTKVPWFHRSHIIGARVWGRRRFCRGRRYRTRPARSVRTSGGRWNLPRRAPPQITSPGRDQGSTFRHRWYASRQCRSARESWVQTFAHFGILADFREMRSHIGEGADRLLPAFLPKGASKARKKEIEDYRSHLFKTDFLPTTGTLSSCMRKDWTGPPHSGGRTSNSSRRTTSLS